MSKNQVFKGIEFLEPVMVQKKVFPKCPDCGKDCLSEKQLRTQLNHMKFNKRFKNKISLRDYYCEDCLWYHLTSQQSYDHIRTKNYAKIYSKHHMKAIYRA